MVFFKTKALYIFKKIFLIISRPFCYLLQKRNLKCWACNSCLKSKIHIAKGHFCDFRCQELNRFFAYAKCKVTEVGNLLSAGLSPLSPQPQGEKETRQQTTKHLFASQSGCESSASSASLSPSFFV